MTAGNLVSYISYGIEAVGVLIIVTGFLLASVRAVFRLSEEGTFQNYRRQLGRAMMLGLEFLVAGDIIHTVIVEHTPADIMALGLIVLIRTVLVFTIHLEVEGRWPWQSADQSAANPEPMASDTQ